MACFLVGGGEAIVVTAVRAAVKKSEVEKGIVDEQGNQLTDPATHGICWTRKLSWLMNMLWGGVILLCIEHMWHGEVVPFPPFLTAMEDPTEIPVMLGEMGTVGVGMAILVTVTWLVVTFAADAAVKRSPSTVVEGA
ncbi:hypothetical protein [Denitrobacterium detoxificans]|uniref:hypothetical protein n=1 Tax=Denitrobacterium detoxificans TaxID=79604 RepID=UPI0026ECA5BD|nr:hypothetical protein [Denitrobacterium detoxificans]MBE6466669.1 hypothetical protein [Denitrobacterium detoxificans]